MSLLPRFGNHAREVELERRVNALQGALAQCKGVARQWWGFRVRFTIGVAVIAIAIGFTLGVYRLAVGLQITHEDGPARLDGEGIRRHEARRLISQFGNGACAHDLPDLSFPQEIDRERR